MLIASGNLTQISLSGQVAVVTGAGGGIGFEAARALAWLGAQVVIAEVDASKGEDAAGRLESEFGPGRAYFIPTDVGDEASVDRLARQALSLYGKVDIVLNNATVTPLGAVVEVPIEDWDLSYRVNLRGPVLLARAFLPAMLERNSGVFVCVSSVGGAYMGAYETLKTAQVDLARTLDAELEGSGVIAFTIGPGLVPTETATQAIAGLAPRLGMSLDEFYAANAAQILSVEAAGVGFAAAVALAERFRGQEIGSIQALLAAGIQIETGGQTEAGGGLSEESTGVALELCRRVRQTLAEQAAGWKQRPLFERQWLQRNFRRHAGLAVDEWLKLLAELERCLEAGDRDAVSRLNPSFEKLASFYIYLQEAAKGYTRDPQALAENLRIVGAWQADAERLGELLSGG